MVHMHDLRAASEAGGDWGATLVGNEGAEADRIGRLNLGLLRSRIADDALRAHIEEFQSVSAAVGSARDFADAERALLATMQLATEITERAGELIRQSFLGDDKA